MKPGARFIKCLDCGTLASVSLALGGLRDRPPAAPPHSPAPMPILEATETRQADEVCINHGDQAAAYLYLNCNNPICLGCVRQSRYYGSEQCKQELLAREPVLQQDDTQAQVNVRGDRVLYMAAGGGGRSHVARPFAPFGQTSLAAYDSQEISR